MIFNIVIFFKSMYICWEWWYMLVIPGRGRARESGVQGQFQLHRELEVVVGPYLKIPSAAATKTMFWG